MSASLAGKRVLLIEDEYFIASDLRRLLESNGIVVIGPVGDLKTAMALAKNENLDAALLDVNLEGAFSYPIADRLTDRGIPYLFVTGYDVWALAPGYRNVPRLAKPFTTSFVIEAIQRLCSEVRPA